MTYSTLEHDVAAALTAAADRIHVEPAEAGQRPVTRIVSVRPRGWLLPAAAAAAVALLLVVGGFTWSLRSGEAAARRLIVTGDTADVGGVRFPVPAGWQVAVTTSGSSSVTVCVAAEPADPCDGVLIRISVPGVFGGIDPLSQGPVFRDCTTSQGTDFSSRYVLVEDSITVPIDGREGVHYWGWCTGDEDAVDHEWVLTDRSLDVYAPPSHYAMEGAAIVAGLDLSQWDHEPGDPLMFFGRADQPPAETPTG